jgi:hypothetical protein
VPEPFALVGSAFIGRTGWVASEASESGGTGPPGAPIGPGAAGNDASGSTGPGGLDSGASAGISPNPAAVAGAGSAA